MIFTLTDFWLKDSRVHAYKWETGPDGIYVGPDPWYEYDCTREMVGHIPSEHRWNVFSAWEKELE